jgi:hypothetical protein
MATHIIMDRNGDARHNFDAKDAKALVKAERRFLPASCALSARARAGSWSAHDLQLLNLNVSIASAFSQYST